MAEAPPDDEGDLSSGPRSSGLRRPSGGIPFTSSAYQALNQRISEYTNNLVEESIRVAGRRHSPDVVSASDVERASEHLGIQPRRRRAQGVGTVGALLLGAALGNILQIAGAPTVSAESAVLTFACGVVGAATMVYGYMRG